MKESFISFVVLFLLAFILWYSNCYNDRIYATFFFFCSLIQLVQYAIYSCGDGVQGARIVFCLAIFQILFVAVALYVSFRSTTYATLLKIYLVLTFLYCAFWILYGWTQHMQARVVNGRIVYSFNGKTRIASYFWSVPIVVSLLILIYLSWKSGYSQLVIATVGVFALMLVGASYYYQEKGTVGSIFDSTTVMLFVILILNALSG